MANVTSELPEFGETVCGLVMKYIRIEIGGSETNVVWEQTLFEFAICLSISLPLFDYNTFIFNWICWSDT